jgi:hypothetical protein
MKLSDLSSQPLGGMHTMLGECYCDSCMRQMLEGELSFLETYGSDLTSDYIYSDYFKRAAKYYKVD